MSAILASGRPDPALLATPHGQRAWKAAVDFEAMALGELLRPMFDSAGFGGEGPDKGPFGGGAAEAAWRPMLTQAIAKEMAAHGGIGLAVPVFNQMLRMQEAGRGDQG
jgi:Rod binding domain-containing protein